MTNFILREVNLPLPILVHAIGLTIVGLYLTFQPRSSSLGIASVGLGLSYLSTSYMPLSENQFYHAAAPVRIILAVLAAVRAFSAPKQERNTLWGIAIYDGLGGLMVGWYLGRFDGIASRF
jgi:hypothetical protein